MNEKELINYYNKFNEDKRLDRRHGIVEYTTTMKYIHNYLKDKNSKIIEVGAGSGKYSIALSNEGYDVTAIELVKHNLMTLRSKSSNVTSYLGNALDLSRFKDNTFDMVLLLGPMYHLISDTNKLKALQEAKRIVKDTGVILISYYMNEYAILIHGFRDNNIKEAISNHLVTSNYHIISKEHDLYSMVRLEDINHYKDTLNLKRLKIIAQDGPADYFRKIINQMDQETFDLFLDYHLKTCEREELLGASSHILDILKKTP